MFQYMLFFLLVLVPTSAHAYGSCDTDAYPVPVEGQIECLSANLWFAWMRELDQQDQITLMQAEADALRLAVDALNGDMAAMVGDADDVGTAIIALHSGLTATRAVINQFGRRLHVRVAALEALLP